MSKRVNPTKEYLLQIQRIEADIRQRKAEAERLRLDAMYPQGTDYSAERVMHSCDSDSMKKVDKYIDMCREIDREVEQLARIRHRIIGEIQRVENGLYSELLYKRYVEGESLERIAREMNYSYIYIRESHGRALQAFGEIIK